MKKIIELLALLSMMESLPNLPTPENSYIKSHSKTRKRKHKKRLENRARAINYKS